MYFSFINIEMAVTVACSSCSSKPPATHIRHKVYYIFQSGQEIENDMLLPFFFFIKKLLLLCRPRLKIKGRISSKFKI